MKLKCVSRYQSRDVLHELGAIIEVSPEERHFLKTDAPGCFEDYVEVKEIPSPPMDKAIKAPPRSKRVRRTTK